MKFTLISCTFLIILVLLQPIVKADDYEEFEQLRQLNELDEKELQAVLEQNAIDFYGFENLPKERVSQEDTDSLVEVG